MSKTDIEEVAFGATNQIMKLVSETHIGGVAQLNAKIHVLITEVLVDTVTASCEQLVAENVLMRTAIDHTEWQEGIDLENAEKPELDTPLTDEFTIILAIRLLAEHCQGLAADEVKRLTEARIAELRNRGGA